jgi:hypothetical protein
MKTPLGRTISERDCLDGTGAVKRLAPAAKDWGAVAVRGYRKARSPEVSGEHTGQPLPF